MNVELLNRSLRPGAMAAIVAAAVFFLFGLAAIMLYRYAAFGEIDWQGLAAFCSLVLAPWMQHAQNRSTEKRAGVADRSPTGGLINNAALS